MSDVATTCIAANAQVGGRIVSKMPGTALFKREVKINKQMSSAALDAKYDDRFDDRGYYSQP